MFATNLPHRSHRRILRLEELSDRVVPANSWTVNDSGNDPDKDPKDGKPETANGTITLQAIFDHLDAKGGGGTINFSGPMTITGSYFYLDGPVTINGIKPADTPLVNIQGSLAFGSGNKIYNMGISDSTGTALYVMNNNIIKGNVIGNAGSYGICAAGTGNKITGNIVGLDAGGTTAQPCETGVLLLKSNNTVGGADPADRNIISGNTNYGVYIPSTTSGANTNNVVIGNRIGTSKDGNTAIPNGLWGVAIQGSSNRIGGLKTTEANHIVSAGGYGGIIVAKGSGASPVGNKIQGNLIGTKADGLSMFTPESATPGAHVGISLSAAGGVTFTTIQKNTIVDFRTGITVSGSNVKGTLIVGNDIGVGKDHATILRNENGITLTSTDGVSIGQREPANRNVISGNTHSGIVLRNNARNTKVFGNYIGTNASIEELGNGLHGIHIESGEKNFIGMTTVTGPVSGEINRIAYNGKKAKEIDPDFRGHAIKIDQGTGNTIRGNVFHDNEALSIYLKDEDHINEVPQNDVAETHLNAANSLTVMDKLPDQDEGPNNLQNHPVLMSLDLAKKTMTWQLNTNRANASYIIDFYTDDTTHLMGYGQPAKFLTTRILQTNNQGYGTVTIPRNAGLVSATATDSEGNTSTFSIVDTDADGLADGWEKADRGIDFDMDGESDQPLPGADDLKKDLYLEADVMSGVYAGINMNNVFNLLEQAFANAPASVGNPGTGGGVSLHINPDIPASNVNFTQRYNTEWGEFSNDKQAHFGDGLSDKQKKAREMAFRYTILANSFTASDGVVGYSGNAELTMLQDNSAKGYRALGGNEFSVYVPPTFFQGGPAGMSTVTDLDLAGTIMHELGHTLGLEHGGTDSFNFKPNYQSVMSYNWQMPSMLFRSNQADADYAGSWVLDYSRTAQKDINENALTEAGTVLSGNAGSFVPVGTAYLVGVGPDRWFTPTPRFHVMPQTGREFAVPRPYNDWLRNGRYDAGSYVVDLNHDGARTILRGAEDWSRLIYNFRESPSSKAGQHGTHRSELVANVVPGEPSGPVAKDSLIVGSDVGVESRVQVIKPDGTTAYDFNPFPGFTGGVRVTKGDVNGDGTSDIIAAMGPAVNGNGGNLLNVYDGTNGNLIYSISPRGANFTGGFNVAAANTDNDLLNKAEIILAPASGNGSTVDLLVGETGASLASFTAFTATTTGGVTVAAGDVNGDGFADIVTGLAKGVNPMVKVFHGNNQKLMRSFSIISKAYAGVNVAVGDFDRDGKMDIVTAAIGGTTTSQPEIRVYSGATPGKVLFAFLADELTYTGGIRVATVETVDGQYSLLTSTGAGKQPKFRRFGALSYEANWERDLFDNTYAGAFVG